MAQPAPKRRGKKVYVAVTVDVDAIAGWLGTYGGEDSICDLSRGEFAGKIGSQRLLELFDSYKIKTTWFIPGHSIETFWDQMKSVADSGHEIGTHGYSHENPMRLSKEQEEKIFRKCMGLIEKLSGQKPVGNRQPWWDFGPHTLDTMLNLGFLYDSSLMGDEFHPYYVRKGDEWSKIDYSKDPDEWMKPYVFGKPTELVEIPVSWYLDDLPPQMFMKHPYYNYGWTQPDIVYGVLFKEHFDYLYYRERGGLLNITIHPDVSGRVQGVLRLENLIRYMNGHANVKFITLRDAANLFKEGRL